mgnify:CR=1 FL=1
MNMLTQEWLNAAQDDLLTMERILDDAHLTHIVAFHAEQAVEKCLKALLEEDGVEFPKTHDLGRLYKLLQASRDFPIDQQDMLQTLNTLYIDSRYRGEFGLLPNGKPTTEDAREFYRFAQEVYTKVCAVLEQPADRHEENNDNES